MVVINAKEIAVTGRKAERKLYRHHTGYPGGLKEINFSQLQQKKPDEVAICRDISTFFFWYTQSTQFILSFADNSKGSLRHVTKK